MTTVLVWVGVVLIGPPHAENRRVIAEKGGVRVLGGLPHLDPLTPATLRAALEGGFRREDLIGWAHNHGTSELAIPRQVMVVEAIPVLGTGKTDYVSVQKLADQALTTQ